MKKRRALVIRIFLDDYDKKILAKSFRRQGYGLREGFRICCSNAVIYAKDDENEFERRQNRK